LAQSWHWSSIPLTSRALR